jgi:MFS family permease
MTITDSRTRWLALIILCLGDLMIVLDVTIVGVALPSIKENLGFSDASLAWVVNAYLLTFGGFLLLGGRLGEQSHDQRESDRRDHGAANPLDGPRSDEELLRGREPAREGGPGEERTAD